MTFAKAKGSKKHDIVFLEHEIMENIMKNVSGSILTYEGVVDLTLEQTSLEGTIDRVEIFELE